MAIGKRREGFEDWLLVIAAAALIGAAYLLAVFGVVGIPYLVLRLATVGWGVLLFRQLRAGASKRKRQEIDRSIARGTRIGIAFAVAFVLLAIVGGMRDS